MVGTLMKSMSEQLWVVDNGFTTCHEFGIGQKRLTLWFIIMNYSAYENINSQIYIAYSEVARESMINTADESMQ